jgi:hypothetical protein
VVGMLGQGGIAGLLRLAEGPCGEAALDLRHATLQRLLLDLSCRGGWRAWTRWWFEMVAGAQSPAREMALSPLEPEQSGSSPTAGEPRPGPGVAVGSCIDPDLG